MPALSKTVLVDSLLAAFSSSGASVFLLGLLRDNPVRLVVVPSDAPSVEIWVYVRTLTPGGRARLVNEYRIQLTTFASPLALNPNGPTVLIGYKQDLDVFAGFDISVHQAFTAGSSSVQISIRALEEALNTGLSFFQKSNSEIAIGIRPDQLLNYTTNSAELHALGTDARAVDLLRLATGARHLPPDDLDVLPLERRTVIQTIKKLSRDSSFRSLVLEAYRGTCAVTAAQLNLVDAAHILPVGAPGSTDEIQNGLCLAPSYHRAYDQGLIYVDEAMVMRPNASRMNSLRGLGLAAGEEAFMKSLGPLVLPRNRRDRPSVEMVRRANEFRKIVPHP